MEKPKTSSKETHKLKSRLVLNDIRKLSILDGDYGLLEKYGFTLGRLLIQINERRFSSNKQS